MAYFAQITDTKTGKTATRRFAQDWDGASDFDWGDNNNSCDCNRAIWFEDAGGELPEGPDDDIGCGDVRFAVVIVDESGKHLYSDPPSRFAGGAMG